MTLPSTPRVGLTWRSQIAVAAACAVLGVVAYFLRPFLPAPVAMVLLGIGLLGASFMLAWAADAGEIAFSGGLVLAGIALVTVLPEFIIEIRFAFIQAADLVTANLTGATRLLLTGAAVLPLFVALLSRLSGTPLPAAQLHESRRLELGILLISAVFAIQVVLRGNLSVIDGVLMILLYVVYARRVQGTTGEEPAVVGVGAGILSLPLASRRRVIVGLVVFAAAVVILIANPFADALLATGTSLGMDPYLLIQSVVPVATEAPEFVVVGVLVANQRPAQGLALFLASSVSQWTLGLGALPIAYAAGGGGIMMPLALREQIELGLTVAVTLFVVAAFATLRPAKSDAMLISGVFLVLMAYPSLVVRLIGTFVLLVFAVDLFVAHRRSVRPVLRSVWGKRVAARPREVG